MKIFNVLSKSLLFGASFLNNFQDGQTKAQEIDSPTASRDISENIHKPSVFSITNEQIGQINNSWIITETIKYHGSERLTLYPNDIEIEYSGENLSNSRQAPHSIPRKTSAKFKLRDGNHVNLTVIPSSNDRQRCQERISVQISSWDKLKAGLTKASVYAPLRKLEELNLNPSDTFQVIYTIDHEHFLHGTYDPLLGERKFITQLGDHKIYNTFDLNSEVNPAITTPKLNTPPKERIFNTDDYQETDRKTIAGRKGEFLYLAADIGGYQYFRFDDMPIRAGDKFKLSFDSCVAAGTEGSCHVRVMEYQDTPNAWYRLGGGFDEQLGIEKENNSENQKQSKEPVAGNDVVIDKRLKRQGRWQRFEQEFTLLENTTTMALDFRIVGANVGEMWIDNLNLENLSVEKEPNRPFYRTSSSNPSVTISQIAVLAK